MNGFNDFFEQILGVQNPGKLPAISIMLREVRKFNNLVESAVELQRALEIMGDEEGGLVEVKKNELSFNWPKQVIYDAVMAEFVAVRRKVQVQAKVLESMANAGEMEKATVPPQGDSDRQGPLGDQP